MELSIESPCQHVTWEIKDFFDLPSDIGYSLDSPEFQFASLSYCLRLYPNGSRRYRDTRTEVHIVRSTSTRPERDILCKFGQRMIDGKGHEVELYDRRGTLFQKLRYILRRSDIEDNRNCYTLNGTLTVFCYMRLGEKSRRGSRQSEEAQTSEAEEEQEGLPGQTVFFSSRWRSSKMEFSIESPRQYVTWKIPDIFQLPSEIGYSLESPEFRFAGHRYCLRFYPKGNTTDTNIQLVTLTSTVSENNVSCKFGCKMKNNERAEFDLYDVSGTSFKSFNLLSRSYIEENRDNIVPDGTLTILCSMRLREHNSAGSPQSQAAKPSETEEEQEGLPDMAKLLSDYKQLLEKGVESDACLVVSGKEFRAHKNILRTRSPVFDAMFDHETVEKESGQVVIDDLDPESFGDFLEYLYTGKVGNGFSDNNVFGLYVAADKYDVPTLKSVCVTHMRRTLSVDSFCDVITVALRHHEEKLLQQAIQFFKDNMARIIVTVKWQQFVIDNGTAANELLIKTIVPREQ